MPTPSFWLSSAGVAALVQIEHGHGRGVTDTVIGAVAGPVFTVSSVTRASTVRLPTDPGVNVYDHDSRPVAGCHVVPPSVVTSTPPTRPPPASAAVPITVTGEPADVDDPLTGDAIA